MAGIRLSQQWFDFAQVLFRQNSVLESRKPSSPKFHVHNDLNQVRRVEPTPGTNSEKNRRPQLYRAREKFRNALEASNAFNYGFVASKPHSRGELEETL